MAIYFPDQNALLLLVPKTGSTWVRSVLEDMNLNIEIVGDAKMRHHDQLSYFDRDNYSFVGAFIRNPISWYQSYWSYRMEKGWRPQYEIDSLCADDNFEQFIRNVTTKMPGALTNIYSSYISSADEPIDFIGKQESLSEDLCAFLRLIGIFVDESFFQKYGLINNTNTKADLTSELEELITLSEWETMKRFNYLEERLDCFGLSQMEAAYPEKAGDLRLLALWTEQIHWVHDDRKKHVGAYINPRTRYARVCSNYALFAQHEQKDLQMAEAKFLEALEHDPRHPRTLCNYALYVWRHLQDAPRAKTIMLRALEVRPNHPYTLGKLARFVRVVENNLALAHEYYNKSLELSPAQDALREEYLLFSKKYQRLENV